MPRPLSSNIHQWAKNAVGKNTALMTNSTKHTFNSGAGIALYPGAIVGLDTSEAIQNPYARRHALARRACSINRTDSVEEILSFGTVLAGFSRRSSSFRGASKMRTLNLEIPGSREDARPQRQALRACARKDEGQFPIHPGAVTPPRPRAATTTGLRGASASCTAQRPARRRSAIPNLQCLE